MNRQDITTRLARAAAKRSLARLARHGARSARWAMTFIIALLTASTAWAQDLSGLSVFTEVPTVDGGQASNWASSESYGSLVDGNTSTKYGLSSNDPWVEFHYAQPITPNGYALWTANDEEGKRNPASWTIKAKVNSNDDWTTLVSVDNSSGNMLPMANDTETRFALENSTAYQYFHLEATRNSSGEFQLAELQFLYTPDPTNLVFATISGISSRYKHTGEAIPVSFSVTDSNGTLLTLGTHYTATLGETTLAANSFSVTDEGSYTVTIAAKDGNSYTGSTSKTFSVVGIQAINLPSVTNGTVTATVNGESVTQATPGDEVTLTIAWNEGYEVDEESFSVKDGNNADVVRMWDGRWDGNQWTCTFTMPETAVTVSATIRKKTFYIGRVYYGEMFQIIPDPERASEGEIVTLTVTKAAGVVMSDLKVWYYNESGESIYHARRRVLRRGGTDEDDSRNTYLELTKVDDTHYTFTTPAADVQIECNVSYTGQYALNRAEGIPTDAIRFVVGDGIEATSANAGDRVRLSYNGQVSNISVTGASGAVALDGDYFTMPAEEVTVSADFKYQLYYSNDVWYYTLTAKSGDVDIPADGGDGSYVTPGTVVTLTAKSSDAIIILSSLRRDARTINKTRALCR